jgi:cytochrome bd-type quinol oxidase subunit 1
MRDSIRVQESIDMAAGIEAGDGAGEPPVPTETLAEDVAGGSQWHPLTAAALVGGVLAAGTGAYLGTRALARRNAGKDGKVSSVMQAAITATDLKCDKRLSEPRVAHEPSVPREPSVG